MISKLREPTKPLRVALATPLVRWGVHPNSVTLAAIPLSAAAALCVHWNIRGWSLTLAILAAIMDFLDGEVARLQQRESAFGNYLEAVVDRVVDAMLLIGFLGTHPYLAATGILTCNLVSYSKARLGLVLPTDNSDWPGWGDRTDRLIVLLLAVALGSRSAWSGPLLFVLVAMSITGCVQRVRHAQRRIEEAGL